MTDEPPFNAPKPVDDRGAPIGEPSENGIETGAIKEVGRHKRFAKLGTLASLILFAVSLVILWRIVATTDSSELKVAFLSADWRQIGWALLLTTTSYLLLTCYDAAALWQLRVKVRYRTMALASFASYAISFTLGFPIFTAGTVRYWIYAPKGVSPGTVATLTVIAGFTFWLGMGVVFSWCVLTQSEALSKLVYYIGPTTAWFIGLCTAAAVVGYLVLVSFGRRAVKFQGWRLELPGFRLTLAQMLIGAADTCAAAGVLYVLLPGGYGLQFETFLAIYVLAVVLGIASNVPGGVGVFETALLLGLSTYPREPVLGALLLFRVIYYLLPFIIALALLGAYEIRKRLSVARTGSRGRSG